MFQKKECLLTIKKERRWSHQLGLRVHHTQHFLLHIFEFVMAKIRNVIWLVHEELLNKVKLII
jgi:hypothetical protein